MIKGKTALVTGSTSGIGLAMARAFAQEGANIMLNGFGEPDAIEAARAGLEREFGITARYSGADMAKGDEVIAMVREAEAAFGTLDILVNNAGIQYVAPVEAFPPERWEAIIAINLSASYYAIHAALAGMKARGWGRIINIASAHALVASPFKSAYVAAKHGVAGLTKAVALEAAASGVTVNAICPGYVWTTLVEAQIPDTMAARGLTREQVINDVLLQAQPTKAFVAVEEVAAFALFLAGDGARNVTGAVLSMDGGWTAA